MDLCPFEAWVSGDYKETSVVYLGWPIVPSYISLNAGEGGGVAGLSQWTQLYSVHQSPNKLWRSNTILNLRWVSSKYSRRESTGRFVSPPLTDGRWRGGRACELGAGREYWMIYRGPEFLVVLQFGSSPTSSALPAVSSTGDTQEDRERDNLLTGEGG